MERRSSILRAMLSVMRFSLCVTVLARPPEQVTLQEPKTSANGVYKFFIDATANQTYPIAVSPDLIGWTHLTNVVGAGSRVWIEDPGVSNFQRRFYRVGIAPVPITNMVFIPPGSFTMGSPDSELDRETKESPQTGVTLSHGYWIAKYEVTQEESLAVTGTNHAIFNYDLRLPIDFTKWIVATNYCQMLTDRERAAGRLPAGYRYRLPTEAEWEYACRAGTTTPVSIGDGKSLSSTQANFDGGFPYGGAATGNFLERTTIGGTYAPNAWGLYDMHGNVAEWCQDYYGAYPGGAVNDPQGPATGTTRVLRGGAYNSPGKSCRSARRDSRSQTLANFSAGFRVVLAADP